MKPRTVKQRCHDYFDVFRCIKEGRRVKRSMNKDGSIKTVPVIPCPDVLESVVQQECLDWLRANGIMCDRHDCGTGDFGFGIRQYGIKSAGDIIGCLKNGKHFEIECKKGKGGRLSSGQQKRWRKVEENNGMYLVIHGIEELIYYKELIL